MDGINLSGSSPKNPIDYTLVEKSTSIKSLTQMKFSKIIGDEGARIIFKSGKKDIPDCNLRIQSTKTYTDITEAQKQTFLEKAYKVLFRHDRWIPLQIGQTADGKPIYVKVNYASLQERLFLDDSLEKVKKEVQSRPVKRLSDATITARSIAEGLKDFLVMMVKIATVIPFLNDIIRDKEKGYQTFQAPIFKDVDGNTYVENVRYSSIVGRAKKLAKLPDKTEALQEAVLKKLDGLAFEQQAKTIQRNINNAKKYLNEGVQTAPVIKDGAQNQNVPLIDNGKFYRFLDGHLTKAKVDWHIDRQQTLVKGFENDLEDLDKLIERGWEKGAQKKEELLKLIQDLKDAKKILIKRAIDSTFDRISDLHDDKAWETQSFNYVEYLYNDIEHTIEIVKAYDPDNKKILDKLEATSERLKTVKMSQYPYWVGYSHYPVKDPTFYHFLTHPKNPHHDWITHPNNPNRRNVTPPPDG